MSEHPKWDALWDRIVVPLAIVVVAAIAIGIYFENRTDNRESDELRTNGITTTASLGNNYKQRDRWGRTEYELTYTFDANGTRYSKIITVDQRPTASDVKIVYLPSDPNVSRLVDYSGRTHWEDILVAAIVAGVLCAITLAWRFAVFLVRRFRY